MKILGVYRGDGSSYHRVFLALKDFNTDFTDQLTYELCKNYDIIYIHYNCNVIAAELALWKKELGFKLIWDTDDSWNIPKNHILYKELKRSQINSKDLCILADYCICATELLRLEVLEYNSKAGVIPNCIPYGEGQFEIITETLEEFKARPTRVGMIGSIGHVNDWYEIKGWINRIVSLRLKEPFEFVICGYDESFDKEWSKMKGQGIKFIHAKDPESYMELYKGMDIMLCPLEDNEFNRAKSDLKIMEAACTATVCVLDQLYDKKGVINRCHINITKESEWFSRVRDLLSITKEELYINKTYSADKVIEIIGHRSVNNYCNRESLFNYDGFDTEEQPNYIYSIKYKEDQVVEFIPIRNTIKSSIDRSYLFENNVILTLLDRELKTKYVGVLSHKFNLKTLFFKKKVDWILEKETADIVTFCNPIKDFLKVTNDLHPGFKSLFTEVCLYLGIPFMEPQHVIYSNYIVARPEIYKQYIDSILIPAIEYMELEEHKGKFFVDSKYEGLSKAELFKYTGLTHYPIIVFILERLWGQWLLTKKFKVKNYTYV